MSKHKKHSAHKTKRKNKKNFSVLLYVVLCLVVFWLAVGIYLFFNKTPASIYISSENPKQGDTVFIRVKSEANSITGNFENEKLVFYKKQNSNDWISLLGIDADQNPGNYKISVDISSSENLTKEINISLADFSTEATVAAPSSQKTGITVEKAANNVRKNDNPSINKVLDNFTPQPYFASSFSLPLNKIEKTGFSFGKFIGFAKDKLQHLGVDLKAPKDTDIFAINDGKVVATLNLSNYGKTIIIDHGLNIFSLYLHLDQFKVFEGQMVSKGQIIGLSGETGYVTGPHLHFSMRVGASRVDPIAFIETTQKINDNFILADISNAFLNLLK